MKQEIRIGKRKGRTGTSYRAIQIMLKISPTKLDEYPIDDLRLSSQIQLRTQAPIEPPNNPSVPRQPKEN